jgi:hypothetical protein
MTEIMESYRVNERAWGAVMHRVRKLREEGKTLDAIGKLLKVSRATVKRWLDYGAGGDRISFRDMVRYIDALRIPLEEVYGIDIDAPITPIPTPYEKHVAAALKATTTALGQKPETIAYKAFGDQAKPQNVHDMFSGDQTMTVGEFISICKAIGITPTTILERATELYEEESGDDHTTRHTA